MRFNIGDIIGATAGSSLPRDKEYRVMRYMEDSVCRIVIGQVNGKSIREIYGGREQLTSDGYWESHQDNYILVRKGSDKCGRCKNSCRSEKEKCIFYEEKEWK